MKRAVGIVVVALALLGAGSARALTLEPVGDFPHPTYVTSDPGDANRLFVVEREGTIDLVENGVTSQFADLSSKVQCSNECKESERGLMSIALAPDFDSSGRLYVDYINYVDGVIHVDELVAEPDRETADAGSLRPLLTIPHPDAANHNGGQLQFGPDNALYVSTGDGGAGDDKFHNAQNLESGLGKILRIEPDPGGAAPFYKVLGNPFPAAAFPKRTIWSYGLRNPFRFSFDSLSGDMVIGDVGQAQREEIDLAPSPFPAVVGGSGVNYGWNCREGLIAGPGDDLPPGQCATEAFTEPVFDYSHSPDPDLGDNRCAVIGGYVARDPRLGALYGHYLYADLCAGGLRALKLPSGAGGKASGDCSLGLPLNSPVSFGEDADRRLYVVEEGGNVYRLAGSPPANCPAPESPASALPQAQQPDPTFVGITAQRRRVERGKAALLTVFVSPCNKRRGKTVELLRNGHSNGSRYLSRACTARFLPRVRQGTTFTAVTRADRDYMAGKSRRLTIRLAKHHRHR